jgi:hypothetical protein
MNDRFGRGWMSELLREWSIQLTFVSLLCCESSLLFFLEMLRVSQRLGLPLSFLLSLEFVRTQVQVVFCERLLSPVENSSESKQRVSQHVAGQAVLNKLNG